MGGKDPPRSVGLPGPGAERRATRGRRPGYPSPPMAKTREIKKRIKAVGNIRRITKTMQMIATSKFAKAQQRALATKPYTEGVFGLVTELAATAGNVSHPLINGPDRKVKDASELTLVITSDRGQCGPYNGPGRRTAGGEEGKTGEGWGVQCVVSPEAGELLEALLPATVKASLFQAFNDALVSEQVARMIAMKAATDNAGKMRKNLTRDFNRARQSQ